MIHNGETQGTATLTVVPGTGQRASAPVTVGNCAPRVLLVEDSDDNRLMMRRLLEMNGYQVVEAVDGEQAVRLARETQPALILMDLNLPTMDGFEATRQIRQISGLADVLIVVVSAYDTPAVLAAAFGSGCNEYVTKPIDVGLLESLMTRLLPAH